MFKCKVDDRVSLKLLITKNEVELFNLIDDNREYLSEWLPWVIDNREITQTRIFIKSSLRAFAKKAGMHCGIFYDNKLVGVIGFHGFDWSNKSTSIGYWLGESYQGKGIMFACVKAFVRYAFVDLGLNRIEIRCAEHNIKSRSIPEKLEFKNEGLLREVEIFHKNYVNNVLYSLLASEFLNKDNI